MKNFLILILLSLVISSNSFAKKTGCTDGDCNNGFGTWTYTDKTTYVGEWENGSKKGKGIEIQEYKRKENDRKEKINKFR